MAIAIPNGEENAVTTKHPEYINMIPIWEAVRDTMKGEDFIKAQGVRYLPMTSGQSATGTAGEARYDAYKLRARFLDIVAPAVRGLVGLAHAAPAEVELPPRMEYLMEAATPDGKTLEDLARSITRESLQTGRVPLLVDSPIEGGEPYITQYDAECLINWKDDDKGYYLAVFVESADDAKDEYSHDEKKIYRVLKMVEGSYSVELYEESSKDAKTGFNLIEEYTLDSDFIPLSVAGSINTDAAPDEPPMLPIARSAISIYQLMADYRQSLFITGQPTPVTTGLGDDVPTQIGSDTVWHLPENGTAFYLEVSGNGIPLTKEAIDDEILRAESHGSKLLQTGAGAEAAETLRLRMLSQYATLQSVVMSGAEAIELSLKNIAVWLNINPDEVSYRANTAFVKAVDLSQLGTINQAVTAGNLPKEVLYEAVRQAGLSEMSNDELNSMIEIAEPLI